MEFQAILDGIEAEGQLQIGRIEEDAKRQIAQINQSAEKDGDKQKKRILSDGRARFNRECALIDQQASVQCLQIHADARQSLIEAVLKDTRDAFPALRERKDYPDFFSRMVDETIETLTPSLLEGQKIILRFDSRDKAMAERILKNKEYPVELKLDINSYGGCHGETGDGMVLTRNSIESRFEQARSYLQQKLSVFFEGKISSS